MNGETPEKAAAHAPGTIQMPAPTAWPIVMAFGFALLGAALVTSGSVGVLGGILAIAGAVGWFRDVLPHEEHEAVPIDQATLETLVQIPREVEHIKIEPELQRAWLPLEIYPVSAGIKGGLAGSVAMAILAMMYGVFSGNGIWYPINLLVAGFFPVRSKPPPRRSRPSAPLRCCSRCRFT